MIPLLTQRSNADLPSGIAELKNVWCLLQRAMTVRSRSTEVRDSYRGSTSHDRIICHRTPSLRWWYSTLKRPTYHIHRSLNIEYGALRRRCTYVVLFEISSNLQLNPTKSEIIWFGSRTSLKWLQHTDLSLHVSSRDQAYHCCTWLRCAARQWTGDAVTHQQTHGTKLLSSLMPDEGVMFTGPHYHMQTGVCFRLESNILL